MPTYSHNPLCLTQAMTAANAPSPLVASGSSIYGGYAPHLAFNQSASSGWCSGGGPPQWLKIDLGEGNGAWLAGYSLTTLSEWSACNPRSWTLAGSNNDTDWTTLATETDVPQAGLAVMTTFSVPIPSAAYRYFRINVTAGYGDFPAIGELELLGFPPPSTRSHLQYRGRNRFLFTGYSKG